jgi:hypothetical protein
MLLAPKAELGVQHEAPLAHCLQVRQRRRAEVGSYTLGSNSQRH